MPHFHTSGYIGVVVGIWLWFGYFYFYVVIQYCNFKLGTNRYQFCNERINIDYNIPYNRNLKKIYNIIKYLIAFTIGQYNIIELIKINPRNLKTIYIYNCIDNKNIYIKLYKYNFRYNNKYPNINYKYIILYTIKRIK